MMGTSARPFSRRHFDVTSSRSPFGATFAPCGIMHSSAYTDAARSTADTANSDLHLRLIACLMADMFNFHATILSNSAMREHTQSGTNQGTLSDALLHPHAQEERGRRAGRSSSRSATICAGVTTTCENIVALALKHIINAQSRCHLNSPVIRLTSVAAHYITFRRSCDGCRSRTKTRDPHHRRQQNDLRKPVRPAFVHRPEP